MNKPKGFVTSLDDPHADKTVMDLLKGAVAERVYPVGRLDKNSVGVLLITNDGELTRKLTHPSYNKQKVYQVTLDKPRESRSKTGRFMPMRSAMSAKTARKWASRYIPAATGSCAVFSSRSATRSKSSTGSISPD